MKKVVFFIVLLMIAGVSAASVDYQIIGNRVLVEADFDNVSNFELKLPYDINLFESSSFYELVNMGNYQLLKVDSSNDLVFSYVTDSMLEESRIKNFFIMKSYFPDTVDVRLFLPEAGVLMKDRSLIFPEAEAITTDGRRVVLEWDNFDADEIVVAYENVGVTSFWFYVLIMLIAAFIVFYMFQSRRLKRQIRLWQGKHKETKKRGKEKAKKSVSKNLYGDEKRIIDYLMEKKDHESWTKEIVRDLEIPKVRLSRKLRSLEEKELISKEPHGNENRVKLLKKS